MSAVSLKKEFRPHSLFSFAWLASYCNCLTLRVKCSSFPEGKCHSFDQLGHSVWLCSSKMIFFFFLTTSHPTASGNWSTAYCCFIQLAAGWCHLAVSGLLMFNHEPQLLPHGRTRGSPQLLPRSGPCKEQE